MRTLLRERRQMPGHAREIANPPARQIDDVRAEVAERAGAGLGFAHSPRERTRGIEVRRVLDEQEAMRIANAEGIQEAVRELHNLGAKIVAVKQGAKGAIVSDGKNIQHCSVEPVTGGDSVGAGDSFDAGFLAGWLGGFSLEQALKIGCACGRSVASQVGGVKGQITWEEAIAAS